MQRAPLVPFAIAFLAGIIADAHGLSLVAAATVIAVIFVRHDAAIGLAAGLALGALHGHPYTVSRELPTARYAGTITGDVRTDDDTATFAFDVAGFGTLRAHGRVRVQSGERLIVRGRIEPFDEPRNPGEPSARAIALDEGASGQLFVERILARAPPDLHDVRVWPALLRARASEIVRASIPEPAATVLAGALWGERGTLPHEVRDDFQTTGTVHVLVTAGLHLGVLAAIIAFAASALGVPRIAAALGTIPLLYAYAYLSGWHLPSQRAAAMLTIALIARAFGMRAISLNTVACAAIVVAAAWPVAVESVSFALSFSCVLSIVFFAEPIAHALTDRRVPHVVAEALALTSATQIGVWPLTAATFFALAPYAIVANAVVVPLIGVTMLAGIALIAVHPIAPLAFVAARLLDWLLAIILATTHAVAALPGARITIAPPPWWAIVAYDLAAIGAAWIVRVHPGRAVATILVASVAVVIAAIPQAPRSLQIIALDVGQGDAIVIRTPGGRTVFIDAGGRLERGPASADESPAERAAERIVVPFVRRSGITTIDLLVLTHPHGDHVGGCLPLLRAVRIAAILDSGQVYNGRAYRDCISTARTHHVPIILARRGMQWLSGDGVTLNILAPSMPLLAETGDDVNENSIVIMLRAGGFRELFMGDAGEASENRLITSGVDVRADAIKVGHHGSRYASTPAFVAAVHPKFAIISVGRHNTFGHPAESTVDAWRNVDADVLRTDRCGAISLIDGSPATMLSCPSP